MTRYDKLIDSIKDRLYFYYHVGEKNGVWDEEEANEVAHEILLSVEEYQSSPLSKSWRASD